MENNWVVWDLTVKPYWNLIFPVWLYSCLKVKPGKHLEQKNCRKWQQKCLWDFSKELNKPYR